MFLQRMARHYEVVVFGDEESGVSFKLINSSFGRW